MMIQSYYVHISFILLQLFKMHYVTKMQMKKLIWIVFLFAIMNMTLCVETEQ